MPKVTSTPSTNGEHVLSSSTATRPRISAATLGHLSEVDTDAIRVTVVASKDHDQSTRAAAVPSGKGLGEISCTFRAIATHGEAQTIVGLRHASQSTLRQRQPVRPSP